MDKQEVPSGLFPRITLISRANLSRSYSTDLELQDRLPYLGDNNEQATRRGQRREQPASPESTYEGENFNSPGRDEFPSGEQPREFHETSPKTTKTISRNQSSVQIVDDAASSICVDNDGIEREKDLKDLAVSILQQGTSTQHPPSDFELYTQRTARDLVLRERADRANRKRKLKRKQVGSAYVNYFDEPSPGKSEVHPTQYTPSYAFDHFDGRRQNQAYNHQLNILNEQGLEKHGEEGSGEQNGADDKAQDFRTTPSVLTRTTEFTENTYETQNRMRTAPSIITVDVDDLESHMYASESSDTDDDGDFDNDSLGGLHSEDEFLGSERGHSRPVRHSDKTGHRVASRKTRRRLQSRHMQLLALAGTLGSGLFYNSSASVFSSGPVGTLIGYLVTGLIAWCTMVSLGEMVSLLPSEHGITSFGSRFVDDSLGFTLGVLYWFSTAISVPTELVAAAILITEYPLIQRGGDADDAVLVWITFFLVIVVLANLAHVGAFGELTYWFSLGTFVCILILYIYMIVVNAGGKGPEKIDVGFRYWTHSSSIPSEHQFYGPFRPFYTLKAIPIAKNALVATDIISGSLGRFVQFLTAVNQGAGAYMGTEVVFTAAAEVRNPGRAIPSATRRIFWRILIIYCVGILILVVSVYAGDPRLVQPRGLNSNLLIAPDKLDDAQRAKFLNSSSILVTASPTNTSLCSTVQTWFSSPKAAPSAWIIALEYTQQCGVAAAANALFIICLVASAATHLYASSRTLYGMALQGNVWHGFAACSIVGVPWLAVLTSSIVALLAYISSCSNSATVFMWLISLSTSTGLIVWAGFCLSFTRFYRGLKVRNDHSNKKINRHDDTYPYRSRLQPYTAYFGVIMNTFMVLSLGFTLFLKGQWNTSEFFAVYSAILIFVICYSAHKIITRSCLVSLAAMDLDSGRKEIAKLGWKEDRVYRYGMIEWMTRLGLRR